MLCINTKLYILTVLLQVQAILLEELAKTYEAQNLGYVAYFDLHPFLNFH